MIDKVLFQLEEAGSAALHPPIEYGRLMLLQEKHRVHLPWMHKTLLLRSNGIEIYSGYYRLFGLTDGERIDMVKWNDPTTWKFAWPRTINEYWCFGESAWGDQYAYRLDELGPDKEAKVYLLDGITMEADLLARDYECFLEEEFLRCATAPYDEMVVAARRKFGELLAIEHLTYVPSLLVGGEERLENVLKMDALVSMVVNGDLATQLAHTDTERSIRALETYEDAEGRTRLRVLWADD